MDIVFMCLGLFAAGVSVGMLIEKIILIVIKSKDK